VEGTTQFEMDLNTGLTQVLSDGTNTYLYGNGRIGQFTGVESAYFLGDALGSVRQLTNKDGVTIMAQLYAPYGDVMSSMGDKETTYGYTGEWHSSSDLLYLRARFYDPLMGRFVNTDSWKGRKLDPVSYNAWLYTSSNPVNLTDPTGHHSGCEPYPYHPKCQGHEPNINGYDEKRPPENITFLPSNIHAQHININGVTPGTNFAQKIGSNNGLCGQAAITWILSSVFPEITLNEVYELHKKLLIEGKINKYDRVFNPATNEWEYKSTKDPNYTEASDLKNFINNSYSKNFSASSGYLTRNNVDSYVRNLIMEGSYYTIVGFAVDKSFGYLTYGKSSKFSQKNNSTRHWGVIVGTSQQWSNYSRTEEAGATPWQWVKVFNPFDNEMEYYWWGDFKNSWLSDKNGNLTGAYYIRIKRVYNDRYINSCNYLPIW
jgi:RHS repeat-associated protein